MSAPDRARDPKRQPRVEDVRAEYGNDWFKNAKAAEFINAKKLNIIDGSKGETVGGNLAKAMDLAAGKAGEAREKSLWKTHDMLNSKGYGANIQARPLESYEKGN